LHQKEGAADQMGTEGVLAVRNAEYRYAVEECALPVIRAARKIGCTTGEHLAQFLNAVGVLAPNEPAWTKNAANRAVAHLVAHGHLKWPRHRGRRNPELESKRIANFKATVRAVRKKEGYHK
jgi:hypothetical protein